MNEELLVTSQRSAPAARATRPTFFLNLRFFSCRNLNSSSYLFRDEHLVGSRKRSISHQNANVINFLKFWLMEPSITVLFMSNSDIFHLSSEQLEYIPKIVLLKKFGWCIEVLWDRLPAHITVDSEVQSYRICRKHFNLPNVKDGGAPRIRDCYRCNS